MVQLTKNARPDERFHLQDGAPVRVSHVDWGWIRRTRWSFAPGSFTSWWFANHLQWYHGTAKCDGTRTRMGWAGQLGDPTAPTQYVITTTPSEMHAFRWRTNGPGEPLWDNQGGS